MLLFQLTLFLALFFLSMLFSAQEAALTALSSLRAKKLSLVNPALRPALSEWLSHPHRLLTTILVGNNFVNVAASSLFYAMALPLSAHVPERLLDVLLWLTATVLFVAGGEVLPKIVGRTYREALCTWGLPVINPLKQALFLFWGPVGWALKKTAPRLAQAPINPLMVTSLEELHHALQESESQGEVSTDDADMIRRTMALTVRTASQIMTPAAKVDGLSLDLLGGKRSPDFYVDMLVESGHTRVPVFKKNRVAGHVKVTDLLDAAQAPVLEKILRPLQSVPPDMKVLDLLQLFKVTGEPVAAVQAEDGGFLGLVTLEDVLEEIVGEILDEYDTEHK